MGKIKKLKTAEEYINFGNSLQAQGKYSKAVKYYKEALILKPNQFVAWNNIGTALYSLGKVAKAKSAYKKVLQINPQYTDALNSMGVISKLQGNLEDSESFFKSALICDPVHIPSYNGLGQILKEVGKFDEARNIVEKAVAINPAIFQLHYLLADIFRVSGRIDDAEISYKTALSLTPQHARAWGNLATVYKLQNKLTSAQIALEKAISIDPNLPHLYFNLGMILEELGFIRKCIDNLEQAIKLNPDFKEAASRLFLAQRKICDWENIEKLEKILDERNFDSPFTSILRHENPVKNLEVARNFCQNIEKLTPQRPFIFDKDRRKNKSKIRVGYISGDFRDHPIGQLTAAMFTCHDRKKFEVFAYSYRENDDSSYYKMIKAGVDKFNDVTKMDDMETARKIYNDRIDMLVDLAGLTGENRLKTYLFHPAPIQVTWLGFPGTSGTSFFDYAIVDKTVVPKSHISFYSEQLVFLPRCYQVNNNTIEISKSNFKRRDFGLPEIGVVFASFNKTFKLEPVMWAVWMKILQKVPLSVLWLWKHTADGVENLQIEAAKSKVDPKRLIFSDKLPKSEHLKRLALADLGLDTGIYGGHTTTSDMLWAGVPIITTLGNHFASRVCASILTEAGLPELVTNSLKEYEDKAVFLAQNPQALKKIRNKITQKSLRKNLYDTRGFVADLEKAYSVMWENWKKGLNPKQIDIL